MAVVGGIVAGATASYVGASLVVAVGVGIAAAVAYDYAMDALMEDATVDTMGGRNVNTKATTGAREIVYGKIRKGGNILWQDVAGENNKFLYQITAISHSECQSIDKVYFDGDEAWSGGVYNSNYFESNNLNIVKIEVKTGTSTQSEISTVTTGTDTAVSYWVNSGANKHTLSNIAYVWTRFTHNPEKFPNGAPAVTALIQGRKVYDPRVSGHSESNPATWAFSRNPVLCLFDYLRNEDFGAGIPASEFDEAQIESAATFCDASVGTPARTRYVCDGVVNTGQSIRQNIKNLLTCMNGRITYAGGKLRIEPYQYSTPHSTDLDEDIITSGFTVTTKTPRQDNYNVVKGTFVSEDINYVQTEYTQQDSSNDDYVTADGGKHTLVLDLPFTTNTIRAQRLAKLVLLRSRMQSRIKTRVNAKGLDYKVGDNVNVTNAKFGIVDNVYEITNCSIGFDKESGVYVDIEARENSSAVYDHTASTDIEFTAGQVITLPDRPTVAAVDANSITVEPHLRYMEQSGDYRTGILIRWDAPDGVKVDLYDVTVQNIGRGIKKRYSPTETELFVGYSADGVDIKIAVRNIQGFFSPTVTAQFNVGNGNQLEWVDFPVTHDFSLKVADAQATPTTAQWVEAAMGAPLASGSILTVVEENALGIVVDVENYVWKPNFRVGIPHGYDSIEANGNVALGSSETFQTLNAFYIPDEVRDNYTITFSISVNVIRSNFGLTEANLGLYLNAQTAASNNLGDYCTFGTRLLPSYYNNVTITDEKSYLYYNLDVTLTAQFGSQTETVPFRIYGSIR